MNYSLYKKFILVLLIPVFGYGVQYAFNILLAHQLEDGLYGDFMVGLRTLSIVSGIVLLGVGSASKRFLSQYIQSNNNQSAKKYINWNMHLFIRNAIILIVCLMGLLGLMLLLHVFNLKDFRHYHLTFYMLFISPLAAFSFLLITYLQSENKIFLYNLLSQAGRYFIYTMTLTILYYCFSPHFNNAWLWLVSLIAFILLVSLSLTMVFFYFPRDLFASILSFKNFRMRDDISLPAWRRTALHFTIIENIHNIACSLDFYCVKLFSHNPFTTSQYTAILLIGNLLWILSNSISAYLEPKISLYVEQKNNTALRHAMKRVTLINIFILSLALLGLLFFGKNILQTFGSAYVTPNTEITLSILVIGYYFGTFSRAHKAFLAYSGNEMQLIYIMTLAAIITLILLPILTIAYGMIGAVIAAIIGVNIRNILYVVVASRKMKLGHLAIF